MSKITIDGLEEILGLRPKPPPPLATPPVAPPQNQNPVAPPVQTGVPSVVPPPSLPKNLQPPPGFPTNPPMGNANPLNQAMAPGNILQPNNNPGPAASGMVPKAVAAQYAKNKATQAKRDLLGTKSVKAPPPPNAAVTPPPPPNPQSAPVQYKPPNKALEYIGEGLALLFGGSRMGAAGAGLVEGLGERSQNNYQRAVDQRQAQIAAAQQGYDVNTGQPLPASQIFTPKQMYTPPNATPQQLEQHYLRMADIAGAYAAAHPGDPQAQATAKFYQTQAATVATGFQKFASGKELTDKAKLDEALAQHWSTWNQTYLQGITGREKVQLDEMARRFRYSVQLRGMADKNEADAIAERAALYAKTMSAQDAFRKALQEGSESAAALREQAALQAAGTPEDVGVPGEGGTTNVFNIGTGTTTPGGTTTQHLTATSGGKPIHSDDGGTTWLPGP